MAYSLTTILTTVKGSGANTYYGGCMCSYNQVSSMALPGNKAETEENP